MSKKIKDTSKPAQVIDPKEVAEKLEAKEVEVCGITIQIEVDETQKNGYTMYGTSLINYIHNLVKAVIMGDITMEDAEKLVSEYVYKNPNSVHIFENSGESE